MEGIDQMDGMPTAPDTGMARPRRLRRRVLTAAVGVGAAAGVAIGAAVAAGAATSPTTTAAGGSTSTTAPAAPHQRLGGRFHARPALGGGFGPGGFGLGGGGVVHGQYTIKGPNGYETLDVRTGTVSAVSNTSGNTWSLTVKSADGTSGTFTVNASTSVNGGESGIGSVKTGDTVDVTGTVSGSSSTATRVIDQTTLEANGKSWMPSRPTMGPDGAPPGSGAGPESSSTTSAT
jgi:hypothetical protein